MLKSLLPLHFRLVLPHFVCSGDGTEGLNITISQYNKQKLSGERQIALKIRKREEFVFETRKNRTLIIGKRSKGQIASIEKFVC